MAKICTTVTTWVIDHVIEPAERWVEERQQQCRSRPWPLNWFCWFVTTLVKIIVWIEKEILIPVHTTTCKFTSWTIGKPLTLITWGTWREFIEEWLLGDAITFVDKVDSPSSPGKSDYTFTCNCSSTKKESILVTASTDKEAAELAKDSCKNACG